MPPDRRERERRKFSEFSVDAEFEGPQDVVDTPTDLLNRVFNPKPTKRASFGTYPKINSVTKASLAVDALRTEHPHDATNAEDRARKVSEHICAIDWELEALSEERKRLAEECLQAVEAMATAGEKYAAVAKNDYRDPR